MLGFPKVCVVVAMGSGGQGGFRERKVRMGLDFAIEELYATGWSALDTAGCEYHSDGRAYPTLERVRKAFAEHGHELMTRHVQLFDCYRAEWRDGNGQACGAVVGQRENEAAVYALSQFRRQLAAAEATA